MTTSSPSFGFSTAKMLLTSGEMHVWLASLDQPASRLRNLEQALSSEEWRRSERFRLERDRNRFLVRRGVLRGILGFYLATGPERLRLHAGENGRPAVLDPSGRNRIEFSISHSAGLALLAFSKDREVGIDIERVRDIAEMDLIGQQCFSSKENELMRSAPQDQKREVFFAAWTCREAFLKALGYGLSRPMEQIEVLPVAGERFKSLRIGLDSGKASLWTVGRLDPAPGFAAAFCAEGGSAEVRFLRWPTDGP